MNLHEIKQQKEDKVSALIKEAGMFFAFSNQQFDENKTPKAEGEKYVHLFAGAYLPKSKLNVYLDGMDAINKWFKEAIKDSKLRREHIIYELSNHEAWYTGDIEDTLAALGSDYTAKEVWKVFNEEKETQMALRD
jgi:outer membrane phospholipase A